MNTDRIQIENTKLFQRNGDCFLAFSRSYYSVDLANSVAWQAKEGPDNWKHLDRHEAALLGVLTLVRSSVEWSFLAPRAVP